MQCKNEKYVKKSTIRKLFKNLPAEIDVVYSATLGGLAGILVRIYIFYSNFKFIQSENIKFPGESIS